MYDLPTPTLHVEDPTPDSEVTTLHVVIPITKILLERGADDELLLDLLTQVARKTIKQALEYRA